MGDNRIYRNGLCSHRVVDDFAATDWTGIALPHLTQVVNHSSERTSIVIDKKNEQICRSLFKTRLIASCLDHSKQLVNAIGNILQYWIGLHLRKS